MEKRKNKTRLARAAMTLLVMLFCFTGARAQKDLPYSYGFEDNNLATDGWTTVYEGTANAAEFGISSDAKKTGNYGFRFSSYSRDNNTYDQYLISPEFNTTSSVLFQFYYKASSSYGTETFIVGYSTTDAEITSFTFGDEIATSSTDWTQSEEYVFPAGTKYVAIYYYSNYQYRLYVDDFSFEAASCPKPKNLNVTTDGETATATWEGTADSYNIDINGTVTNNVTSPYTFNVELAKTYTVKVQASCGGGETSDWSSPFSFTTPDCIGGHVIEYTLDDSYGDGWNGNAINVVEGCGNVIATLTIENGNLNSGTLTLCSDNYEFVWVKGSYPTETSWTFTEGGITLFSGAGTSNMATGDVLYTIGTTTPKPTNLAAGTPGTHEVELTWTPGDSETAWQICLNNDESTVIDIDNTNSTINDGTVSYTLTDLTADTEYSVMVRAYIDETTQSCWSNPVTFTTAIACARPENLTEANITTNSADLSWEGTNDSYVLQLRPWHQVGEDKTATATLETYTYDLSEYSGTGSIAIRHYDVSDMFMLNVDDIVVKNAAGTTIYSQDFESGTIPSNITNMDLDGDGDVWKIRQNEDDELGNPAGNENYSVSSASWISGVGAIHPDNWLIISGIELGGTLTFVARGQDPEWPDENFAVYVSAESDLIEVSDLTTTSYNATNLEPNTPYAWQVKGVCSETDQSRFVSSFFKTEDDLLVFATDGNWNDVSNWKDAEGNAVAAPPTASNNVRIDADARIPAGCVAEANKITIGTGSITINDGGQLKQSSATVKVTVEREIPGYGESDAKYKFIASPFSGRTLYDEETDWNHIESMFTDNYDLYAFDPTVTLEWINYESSSTHLSFQSNNGNEGLMGSEGYLYANATDQTLKFVGSIGKSNNITNTVDVTYDANSTNPFNGWKLIGNPFACNGYVTYSEDATFYKMNEAGDGFEAYKNGVELAPAEGAFIKVSASGTITYSSEKPEGFTNTSTTAAGILPILRSHGETTNQDANLNEEIVNIKFAKEGYATYYNGEKDVELTAGIKAYVVTEGGSSLTYDDVADGDTDNNLVPAGTAVLLEVEAAEDSQTLSFYLFTPSADAYTGKNLLKGSDVATETTGGAKYYKLTYSNDNSTFGWFWGKDNGAAFTSPAHKAWLALPASSARSFLGLPDWQDATGIAPVSIDFENGEWYTLQGLKIGKKPTSAGVYIHNGRKVVVK